MQEQCKMEKEYARMKVYLKTFSLQSEFWPFLDLNTQIFDIFTFLKRPLKTIVEGKW